MKSLFFLLFLIPFQGSAQEFSPIIASTNIGTIRLSENYIHFDHCGVQRIQLIHENDRCVDLFAWTWRLRNFEFRFETLNQQIWLMKYCRNDVVQKIKVLNYRYR